MTTTEDPFEHTATGILGCQRRSMLHNELHLKNELGKNFDRNYTCYPGKNATYGRPNYSLDDGVPGVMNWKTLLASCRRDRGTYRDFLNINKAATVEGLTNARQHSDYRATHDIRRSFDNPTNIGLHALRKPPPSYVFGRATRPSTPINDLLEHRYQDEWIKETKALKLGCPKPKCTELRSKQTVTSLRRHYQEPVDPAPLWQMPRFSKSAVPHLDTFRCDKAKMAAFKHRQLDSIDRKGVIGQGVYEPAQN